MPQHSTTSTPAIAYSYIRFSTPEQLRGDSLRRQTEAAAQWCGANNITLDTSLTLHDLGKSAYLGAHRQNPDRNALAAFLKLVETGKIVRGSYLLVENLDRLTREHVRAAVTLFLSILEQGVHIVTTGSGKVFRHDSDDMTDVIIAVVELARGHGESARKAETLGSVWSEKRRRRRNGEAQKETKRMGKDCNALTARLPAWCELKGGKIVLIPHRAAVLKRIFHLAAVGHGRHAIVRRLVSDNVPPFGEAVVKEGKKRGIHSGKWTVSYVLKLLEDRRVLGEYQPRSRGQNDGEAIKDYYPATVTEPEWFAAQAARDPRRGTNGRPAQRQGKCLNLWGGLLRNARDGDSYIVVTRGRPSHRALITRNSHQAQGKALSFQLEPFETAILSALREIDAHSILNGDDGPDESLALAGELTRVEERIASLEAELLSGEVAAVVRVLRALEEQKKGLAGKLAEARQKAAHPLSEDWGTAQSLLAALDNDDARTRLRAALRRIVEEIRLLVVPRGRDRLCAVQIRFAPGGRQRSYLIHHRLGSHHREGGSSWVSFADLAGPGDFDLRNKDDVRELEQFLANLDLDDLDGVE